MCTTKVYKYIIDIVIKGKYATTTEYVGLYIYIYISE